MREKIKLLSTANTGHFYVAMKNKRLHPEKLETKKYDPVVRKHVTYYATRVPAAASSAQLASRATDPPHRGFRAFADSANRGHARGRLGTSMPELPEAQTTRRGIEPHVTGRVI